jgi:hypothetical protein
VVLKCLEHFTTNRNTTVADSDHLLLPEETVVLAYEHKQNIIPCKPTAPDVQVTLFNDVYEVNKSCTHFINYENELTCM